jgi:hypothetical protein
MINFSWKPYDSSVRLYVRLSWTYVRLYDFFWRPCVCFSETHQYDYTQKLIRTQGILFAS